jgi:hypothetical protein
MKRDVLRELLADLKRRRYAQGNLRGLLNVLIGRRILAKDGTLISTGLTWRAVAEILKKVRWDKEAARDVGLDPATLPPRDRQRYWYLVIAHAQVDSAAGREAGDRLADLLNKQGYSIGPAPRGV